jgi:hypothetical protein
MTNYKLLKDMCPQSDVDLEVMQAIPFQNVIRNLMYAMICKRPNIAQVVGVVS